MVRIEKKFQSESGGYRAGIQRDIDVVDFNWNQTLPLSGASQARLLESITSGREFVVAVIVGIPEHVPYHTGEDVDRASFLLKKTENGWSPIITPLDETNNYDRFLAEWQKLSKRGISILGKTPIGEVFRSRAVEAVQRHIPNLQLTPEPSGHRNAFTFQAHSLYDASSQKTYHVVCVPEPLSSGAKSGFSEIGRAHV